MSETASPPRPKKVPNHVVLRIAAELTAAPATVRKVLAGEPVRGGVYDRIVAALARAGFSAPSQSEEAP